MKWIEENWNLLTSSIYDAYKDRDSIMVLLALVTVSVISGIRYAFGRKIIVERKEGTIDFQTSSGVIVQMPQGLQDELMLSLSRVMNAERDPALPMIITQEVTRLKEKVLERRFVQRRQVMDAVAALLKSGHEVQRAWYTLQNVKQQNELDDLRNQKEKAQLEIDLVEIEQRKQALTQSENNQRKPRPVEDPITALERCAQNWKDQQKRLDGLGFKEGDEEWEIMRNRYQNDIRKIQDL